MSKPLTFEDLVPSAPNGRFAGIRRPYSAEDVVRLRGSFRSPTRLPNGAPTSFGSC